jgi:F0F1-type ATP synthase gamma subunit
MALVGEFGMGKTSLLKKLHSLDIGDNVSKVYITLKDTYANSFEDVIGYIYTLLGNEIKKFFESLKIKINVSYFELESDKKFSKDDFREYMVKLWKEVSKKSPLIIVFIDDFHLAYKYFVDIRNCFQELHDNDCKFMLVVTMIPEPLKLGKREDPYKRFFDLNEVREFTKKDTVAMIQHILKKTKLDVTFSTKVLDDIYSKTRGHPYYTFLMINEILRCKNSGCVTTKQYNRILPKTMDNVKITFDAYYSSLSYGEEDALKHIIDSDEDVFSPGISGSSSPTSTFKSLEEKDVIVKIGYGQYQFKHPFIRYYFIKRYTEKEK